MEQLLSGLAARQPRTVIQDPAEMRWPPGRHPCLEALSSLQSVEGTAASLKWEGVSIEAAEWGGCAGQLPERRGPCGRRAPGTCHVGGGGSELEALLCVHGCQGSRKPGREELRPEISQCSYQTGRSQSPCQWELEIHGRLQVFPRVLRIMPFWELLTLRPSLGTPKYSSEGIRLSRSYSVGSTTRQQNPVTRQQTITMSSIQWKITKYTNKQKNKTPNQ